MEPKRLKKGASLLGANFFKAASQARKNSAKTADSANIKNTPLEHLERLSDGEILRTFAIFRLVNPAAHIRFAGGRLSIKGFEREALKSGVSAILMGDFLTTVGAKVDEDFEMLARLGYEF